MGTLSRAGAASGKMTVLIKALDGGTQRTVVARLPHLPAPVYSMKTFLLYAITAIAEIVGCYLPWRWLKEGASPWLLVPGALSLALFAWLLTLHGTAAGRVYAAYGGVYVAVAILWLWGVEQVRPTLWDLAGVVVTLAGMSIIAFQPRI
jgi:small multidrug resistance family-3 protein